MQREAAPISHHRNARPQACESGLEPRAFACRHLLPAAPAMARASQRERMREAELYLLEALAKGEKTFEQVVRDATTFSYRGTELANLVSSNPARGVTQRMEAVTGISKQTLARIPVRMKSDGGDSPEQPKIHPFALLSDRVEQILDCNPSFFDIRFEAVAADAVASDFLHSPEYNTHPLVQACAGTGKSVVPVSVYADGVSVANDPFEDTVYAIYIAFMHRGVEEQTMPMEKHTYTVYRKSQMSENTLSDIWSVLLWELQSLAHGRKPLPGQHHKPLHQQAMGDTLGGDWGLSNHVCLMQIKADGAYYCEALGVRQWNSCKYMCPWCHAHRDGDNTWHNFALDAPWVATARDHVQFVADMVASEACGWRKNAAAFAYCPKITEAPYFSWTMAFRGTLKRDSRAGPKQPPPRIHNSECRTPWDS